MTTKTKLLTSLAALTLLGTAACEDTLGPNETDSLLLMEAAVVAADATLEDIALITQPFPEEINIAHGQRGNGMGPGQAGGRGGIGGALSGTREVAFYDVDGNLQDAFDELTTARIVTSLDVAGEVTRGSWSGSIARTRNMEITGLAGENTTRVLNGSGTEEVSHSRLLEDGNTASRDMSGTFTYNDLVVPTPDQETHYPLSGSITREMSVTVVNGPNGDQDRSFVVTITFDGDDTATGSIDGQEFEIDLTAQEGRFPLRRGFGRNFGS